VRAGTFNNKKKYNMNETLKKGLIGILKVAGTFVVTAAGTYLGNIAWEATRKPICEFLDKTIPGRKENEVLPEDTESNEQSN
jgi:hypothetical protein